MLRFLLDTNIVIELLRHRPIALRKRLSDHSDAVAVSSITVAELIYGVERSTARADNKRATDGFLALVDVVPFDAAAAAHAGEIRADLASRGRPIGAYDVLIAGHARSRGLAVVTNNRREFDRVEGLQVQDWTISGS